jgi:hypothetical protein
MSRQKKKVIPKEQPPTHSIPMAVREDNPVPETVEEAERRAALKEAEAQQQEPEAQAEAPAQEPQQEPQSPQQEPAPTRDVLAELVANTPRQEITPTESIALVQEIVYPDEPPAGLAEPTPKEIEDFHNLEQRFEQSLWYGATALREIHDRYLYRIDGYKSWSAYLDVRWRKSARWGYMMLDWHTYSSILHEQGVENFQDLGGLAASRELGPLENHPQELARAVVLARQWKQEHPQVSWVTAIKDRVKEQKTFLEVREKLGKQMQPPLRWDEYAANVRLGDQRESVDGEKVRATAAGEKLSLAEAFVRVAKDNEAPPRLIDILRFVRAEELVAVVELLYQQHKDRMEAAQYAKELQDIKQKEKALKQ